MKPIYVVLIALGTGILGFLAGGGLGLLEGGAAGTVFGGVAGMCLTVDTAVNQKLMTEAEVEKLAGQIGQKFRQKQAEPKVTPTNSNQLTLESSSPICNKFLNTIKRSIQEQ